MTKVTLYLLFQKVVVKVLAYQNIHIIYTYSAQPTSLSLADNPMQLAAVGGSFSEIRSTFSTVVSVNHYIGFSYNNISASYSFSWPVVLLMFLLNHNSNAVRWRLPWSQY